MNKAYLEAVPLRPREHHFIQYRLRGADYAWNTLPNPSECAQAVAFNLQKLQAEDPAFDFRLRVIPFSTAP